MSFPDDPRDLSVSFAFGDTWRTSSPSYDQVSPGGAADDPGPVLGEAVITRGRVGDAAETTPTKVDGLSVRNEDGEYSPDNPYGANYGQLVSGVPVQLAVDVGAGAVPLATIFADDFVPSWAGPGVDAKVAISGMGVLERIARLRDRKSALERFYSLSTPAPAAYWSLSGGDQLSDAAELTSGSGGSFVEVQGRSVLGVGQVAPWLGTGLSLSRDQVTTVVAAPVTANPTSRIVLDATFSWDSRGQNLLLAIATNDRAEGTRWWLTVFNDGVVTYGNEAASTGGSGFDFSGVHHVRLDVQQVGADAKITPYIDGVALGAYTDTVYTLASYTHVVATYDDAVDPGLSAPIVLSNIALYVDTAPPSVTNASWAAQGWAGETAANRISRICTEIGTTATIVNASGETANDDLALDPQPIGTAADILRNAEDGGEGVLDETTGGKPRYTTNAALLNLTPIELNFTTHVADLFPLGIERDWRSAVTVANNDTSATVTNDDDTDAPAASLTRNVPTTAVANHAGWLGLIAFLRKPRYVVVLDLRANSAALALMPADLDLTNRRLQISGLPVEMVGPGPLDLLVVGTKQRVGADGWVVECHCEPYGPYRVRQLANTPPDSDLLDGWLIPDSCSLAAGVDATATSWSVSISPLMTTSASDFPCRVLVGGEEVWVTACLGAASPQTWTVTRSVNGVTKAHNAGAEIELLDPLILTL